MEWFKRLAPKRNPSGISASSASETEQDSAPVACCRLAEEDPPFPEGSFGMDEDGRRIANLWDVYESTRDLAQEMEGRRRIASNYDDATMPRHYGGSHDLIQEEQESRLREETFISLHAYFNAFNIRFGELSRVFEDPSLNTVFPLSGVSPIPIPTTTPSTPTTPDTPRSRHRPTPIGHPHHAVLGAVDALQDLAEAFARGFASSHSSDIRSILRRTFAALKHMEILARYEGNRDAIIRHGALDHLATILKAGCNSLKVDFDPSSLNANPLIAPPREIETLQNVILSALLVIQRCTDPLSYWETFVRTGGERTLSSTAFQTDTSINSRTIGLLTQCAVLVLDAVQDLHRGPRRRERYGLLSQCACALGCLTVCKPEAVRERLQLVDGVETVCRIVGWPDFLKVIADGGEEPWAGTSEDTLRYEFKAQLLGWNLLQFLSGSRVMQREMAQVGAGQRVTELFEWVGWCGSALGVGVFVGGGGSYDDFVGSNLADRGRGVLVDDTGGEAGEGDVESEAAYAVVREALRRGIFMVSEGV